MPGAVSEARDAVVASASCLAGQPLRQAEVQDLGPALRREDHVGALQVPVHDAARVGVRERVGQLLAVAQDLLDGQRALGQARAQRLPLDQLHGDVGLAVGLADFVDRADVRMVELRGEARLAQQARARGVVGQRLGGQDLEGDRRGRAACRGPCRPRPCRRRRWLTGSRHGPRRVPAARLTGTSWRPARKRATGGL